MAQHFESLDSAVLAACITSAAGYIPAATAYDAADPDTTDREQQRSAIVVEALKLYAALGIAVDQLSGNHGHSHEHD